jgi:glycosyltransferase involved in cell wall biosynthesis
LAEEVCFRHAHLVVTISEPLRDELIERGVAPERIVTCPNGFDPARFDPLRFDVDEVTALRHRYGIDPADLLITFVGTFGRWHGAEVFAHAIANLCDNDAKVVEQYKIRFLFVGDGLTLPETQQIVRNSSAIDRTVFTGLVPQDDAPAYLAASDIVVSPHIPNVDGSRFFGSPTKLFEYMAMGKAIIASDLEQIGSILSTNNDTEQLAILIRPGDAEDLAGAIKLLAGDPELRKQLGANAGRRAIERHTWERHVDLIMERLNIVLDH